MSTSTTATVYYLDCPFSDKDEVKSLGAQWDALAKKWFVPSNLYTIMEQFNQWRPNNKIFLNCTFDEKDNVKKAGAKWDAIVKRWYITCDTGVSPPTKFSKWLKMNSSNSLPAAAAAAAAAAGTTKLSAKPHPPAAATSKPRGNAQDATLLRINDNMTVSQLQTECRCRGIKGMSGKNKEWLLEQLEIGTVWQSVVTQQQQQGVVDPKMSTAAPKKKEPSPHKKPAAIKDQTVAKATTKSNEPKKKSTVTKKESPTVAVKATTTTTSLSAIDWSQLPRVSSSLTMIQLSHELLHRQPNVKGTSNKAKSWFLEQLGDGSVWTTSPSITSLQQQDAIAQLPRVSDSVTTVQLMHEILSRRQSDSKGLSKKNKSELLHLVGIGSIWTTAASTAVAPTKNPITTSKANGKESAKAKIPMATKLAQQSPATTADETKTTTSTKATNGAAKTKVPVSAGGSTAKTKTTFATTAKPTKVTAKAKIPVATKMARKWSASTAAETKSIATAKTIKEAAKAKVLVSTGSTAETKTTTTTTAKPTKGAAKAKVLVATKMARKSSISSSIVFPVNIKQPPPLPANLPNKESAMAMATQYSSSAKEIVYSKTPTKKPPPVYPSSTTSLPSFANNNVSSSSSCGVITSAAVDVTQRSSTKKIPSKSQMKPPPVYPPPATMSSSNNVTTVVASSSSSGVKMTNPKTKNESSAKKPPAAAKVPSTSTAKFAAAAEGVKSKASPAKKKKQPAAAKIEPAAKRVKLEQTIGGVVVMPMVSSSMTISQLKDEMMARDPNAKGLSGKSKEFLLSRLGIGTELHSSAEYKAKQDIKAQQLHIYQSRCHVHLLADTSLLRDGKRVRTGRCDVDCNRWICQTTPFRTCELCNWDICKPCFEIASLVSKQDQEREIQSRLDKMAAEDAKVQREWERREAEELERNERWEQQYKRDREKRVQALLGTKLKKFPPNVCKPSDINLDTENKLRYTVWTRDVHRKQSDCEVDKEFDSSFATLKEANLRVEYVFHYKNDSSEEDDVHVDVDKELPGGLRYMRSEPDGGGSLTVSVLPSEAFDILLADDDDVDDARFHRHEHGPMPPPRNKTKYPKHIRNPGAANKNESNKLRFTVWTSCGYDNDGWHSYEGPPEKEFNSSYNTIEEANERAEYVFYYENPWGLDDPEEDFLHVEIDIVSSKTGFRRLQCCPEDSDRWTVSVMPSSAFDYINI